MRTHKALSFFMKSLPVAALALACGSPSDKAAQPSGENVAQEDEAAINALLANDIETTGPWRVKIKWSTATEDSGAAGFIINRSHIPVERKLRPLNADNPLPSVGHASDIEHHYVYYDLDVKPGQKWYYGISVLGDDGLTTMAQIFPQAVTPKPLTEEEAADIEARGPQYRY